MILHGIRDSARDSLIPWISVRDSARVGPLDENTQQ